MTPAAGGSMPGFREYLSEKRRFVDSRLDRHLPPEDRHPEVIHQAIRYSVFAGGKRFRPILSLSVSEALGGTGDDHVHLACALEMVHTYSLIHDDLPAMDDDDYRRGKPCLHKMFGEAVALLAGDALLTLSFELLSTIPGEDPEKKMEVIHRLTRAIGTEQGMIGGQVVDILTQGRSFTSEDLEYIHSSKTGALIEAAASCGAILAGAEPSEVRKISRYGQSLGLAFQIVDDLLDVEGSADQMGKSSGKDAEVAKATYPALFGVDESRRMAVELTDRAIRDVEFLGDRGEILRRLARFVSRRQN